MVFYLITRGVCLGKTKFSERQKGIYMIRNIGFWQSLLILQITAGMLMTSGCTPPQQTPLQNPQDEPFVVSDEGLKDQAIGLYVDAMMLNDLNDREEALRKLNSAIEMNPQFAIAYSLKGDILQEMDQFEDSAAAYEQATIHDPWSFKDFFNLGKVTQAIKQWARSARAYISACELDPEHFEAHYGAAQSLYQLEDYDQSLQYAHKAKEIDPKQFGVELLLGDLHEAQQDHMEAINAYRRALELEGNDPKIMISLSRAYLRSGRYSSAKELLSDVVAMEPGNSLAYQYLGFAQLKLKEIDKAVESYTLAAQADENDWMAHKGLGVAFMLQSMKDQDDTLEAKAIEEWTISLQIKPEQPKLKELRDRYSN